MSISKVFTEMEMDVKSLNIRTSKQGTATIEAGFIVHGREELAKVIGKLRQIDDVIDIERTTGQEERKSNEDREIFPWDFGGELLPFDK